MIGYYKEITIGNDLYKFDWVSVPDVMRLSEWDVGMAPGHEHSYYSVELPGDALDTLYEALKRRQQIKDRMKEV